MAIKKEKIVTFDKSYNYWCTLTQDMDN